MGKVVLGMTMSLDGFVNKASVSRLWRASCMAYKSSET